MATIIILNPVILNLMNTPFNTRGNNFDFLRLFLAVLVILSHSYALGIGNQLADPILVLTGGQPKVGTLRWVFLFYDQRVLDHGEL